MKQTKKVTLISRESDNITLDFQLLKSELESRGIEVQVLTKLLKKKATLSSLGYIGHLIKQIIAMNTSDLIVLDTYCIPVSMLPHKKRLKVIQMWHALSAIKKFGWQTVGMRYGTSEKVAHAMKMHYGYDYVLCASDITSEYFSEAFKVSKDKIVKQGLPRIDYILGDLPEKVSEIHKMYPELSEEKRTILYAPTFHNGKGVDVQGLVNALDLEKYNIIVKLHPIDTATNKVECKGVIYDDQFDTYDLLRVADVVISDYSSFVVEASLVEKPLYLYTYDFNLYSDTNGLNMNFDNEAISKYVFSDANQLAAAVKEKYDIKALKEFKDKYIQINTVNVTRQLADFIEMQL